MKKLQNNFTTPEQSKRLLELGVPAWTADCHYTKFQSIIWVNKDYIINYENGAVPCWSVGRLMEIYETCTSCFFERRFIQHSVLEDAFLQITEDIASTDECWDFSKLGD